MTRTDILRRRDRTGDATSPAAARFVVSACLA